MQTPTTRSVASLNVPKNPSHTTSRAARKLKTLGPDSPTTVGKTTKDKSSKLANQRSVPEKKRSSRESELESQISQLQDDLKKAMDQLSSSESWKIKARHEAEEAKRQLIIMSSELEETRKQMNELSDSEETRVQELRKISQDRDKVWQSELEAVQKQHLMDSTALASAMNEIHRLKIQLDRVSESEASQARHAESARADIQSLRFELTETLDLVDKLKNQLNDSRESEALALEEVSQVQMQLDVMKFTEETLQSEHANTMESYKALLLELEQSKDRENSLEGLVSNLRADLSNGCKIFADPLDDTKISLGSREDDEPELLKAELINMKHETSQLRAALEAADSRYRDEYVRSTLQIRNSYELMERTKSDSCEREAELEEKLRASVAEVEELRGKLIQNKNENQGLNIKMEKTELEIELKNSESIIQNPTSSLMDIETRLQNLTEENEMLKSEILKREKEKNKANDEALASAESARATEEEVLTRLDYLTEEAEKGRRKAARVTEQLDAAQAANSEMEADLRRLKVQSDQWRKAAEVAAAMLSNGDNDKYIERTRSLEYNMIGGKWGSPCTDDTDDDSPKKKNGNMLKKIGVLLKKGQK